MRTVRRSPASPGRLEGSRSGGHSCPCRRRGRSRPGGRRSLCRCRLQWRRRKARHPRRATNRGCARGRIRTCDLPLRRRLLYPLSYAGRIDAEWDTSRRMLLLAKGRAQVTAPCRSRHRPGRGPRSRAAASCHHPSSTSIRSRKTARTIAIASSWASRPSAGVTTATLTM